MYKLAIIGSGGAGLAAALEAAGSTDDIILVTKTRIGSSNTALAQGGISVSFGIGDSEEAHYRDTLKCGHFRNVPRLARTMVKEGRSVLRWLESLGVLFDRDARGRYLLKHSLGATYPRLISCKDRTGAAMVKVLAEKVKALRIKILEDYPVCDIEKKKRCFVIRCVGKGPSAIEARNILLAAGGRCFAVALQKKVPTSNSREATGEVSGIARRLGARFVDYNSFQYHPLGWADPQPLRGRPIPESILSFGAEISGKDGVIRIDSMKQRGALSSLLLKEDRQGRSFTLKNGARAFQLNLKPALERYGEKVIANTFPGFLALCSAQGISIKDEPLFIFPTLHYQNGGIAIDERGRTKVPGIFAAGEITGGIHGTGRLMGNSLLDIICFGRRAGSSAVAGKRVYA